MHTPLLISQCNITTCQIHRDASGEGQRARLISNERTCKYTALSVSQFWKSHLRGSPSFVTLHSVLLHPQMQYLDGQRRRVVVSIGLCALSPSVSSQYQTRPVHSFNRFPSCAYSHSTQDFFARLSLPLQLLAQFLYTYFAIPTPVFVDTYPFCRVKLELFDLEREVGKYMHICVLCDGAKATSKKIMPCRNLRHESIGIPGTELWVQKSQLSFSRS